MILSIDSTQANQIIIKIDDEVFTKEVITSEDKDIFSFLISCLHQRNVTPKDITAIEVNPGPGSFTGTRVGVTIANSLSFALDVPVNGKKQPVVPIYSSPPHITTSKPKGNLP